MSSDTDTGNDEDVPIQLRLDLPAYQGPMELLLDLIKRHEIDIFDIPIVLITRRYLSYVDRINELDLQVGGEWLEMATTLVHIKSKMLLPAQDDDDDEEGPDPRDELVRRLIEYEMFQWAADQLDERPQLKRDFFMAAPKARDEREAVGPPKLRQASLFDLVDALKRVIDDQEEEPEWVYEITREELTLRGVILEVASKLADQPRIEFRELFDGVTITRHRVVTTFLAILEMTRMDMLQIFQPRLDDYSDARIIIERAVIDIVDVSQNLELGELES